MRVRDNRPVPRNWGQGSQESKDRVARIAAGLRGGPRDPTTFDELRVELSEPNATDGEIHQAAKDEGLIVEED